MTASTPADTSPNLQNHDRCGYCSHGDFDRHLPLSPAPRPATEIHPLSIRNN